MSETVSTPVSGLSAVFNTRENILQVFSTHLSNSNMEMMREKVQILHRSSFYLELCSEKSDCSVVEQRWLQGALRLAHTHVRLHLILMEMLFKEICCCRQELQNFLLQTEKAVVAGDVISAALTTLTQLHQHLEDFNTAETRNLGPLDLDQQLLPSSGRPHVPQLCAMLSCKLPVVFDRLKSCTKSTSAYLVWSPHGERCQDPDQLYEVQFKSLHPCVGDQDLCQQFVITGLSCTLDNLTPDHLYQFSVKHLNTSILVFSAWMDTLIMKTCPR